KLHPALTPTELAERVVGIDIHPPSVQIAKPTLLLALGPAARSERRPIRLRVYLANTLRVPQGSVSLFGTKFNASVDGHSYELSTVVLADPPLFDAAVAAADDLADRALGGAKVTADVLAATVKQRHGQAPEAEALDGFWKLHEGFRAAKEAGRDSIWRFIFQNTYKPFFFKEQFDLVVGNPPWLTYSGVTVADYQDEQIGRAHV